jgi:hypothetical protein
MQKSNRIYLLSLGRRLGAWLAFLLCLLLLTSSGWSAEKAKPEVPPPVKPEAAAPQPEKILAQACDLLKSAQQFSFKAEVTDDRVYAGGKKLQFAFDLEAFVQRPNKLRINAQGDTENKQFFYDGKTITLYDQPKNAYAVMAAPATIDEALDQAHKDYGVTVALADLSHATPTLSDHTRNTPSMWGRAWWGVKCCHLAFDKDEIQWQIRSTPGQTCIRKLSLIKRGCRRNPRDRAFTDWNFARNQ